MDKGSVCSAKTSLADQDFLRFRSDRLTFTREDDKAILRRIIDLQGFHLVNGTSVWKSLERKKVCRKANSWRSIMKRFHDEILPNISTFGLSARVVQQFRRGKAEQAMTDDSEQETVEQNIAPWKIRIRKRPKHPIRETKKIEHSDKTAPITSQGSCSSSSGQEESVLGKSRKESLRKSRTRPRPVAADNPDQDSDSYMESSEGPDESSDELSVGIDGEDRELECLMDNTGDGEDEELDNATKNSVLDNMLDHSTLRTPMGREASLLSLSSRDASEVRTERLDETGEAEQRGVELPSTEEFSKGLQPADSSLAVPGVGVTSSVRKESQDRSSSPPALFASQSLPASPNVSRPASGQVTGEQSPVSRPTSGQITGDQGPALEEAHLSVNNADPVLSSPPRRSPSGDRSQRSDSPPSPPAEVQDGSSPNQSHAEGSQVTRRTKRVRATLEKSTVKNELILKVSGLPKDIDPNTVKVSYSVDDPSGEEEELDEAEDPDPHSPSLKRLKLVILARQEKNFRVQGIFRQKFRTPYTAEENEKILKFLEDSDESPKGNKIWKRMEEKKICKGRSWHSMKENWRKNLSGK